MFEKFELTEVGGLRLRRGGKGAPVLLLHGHPQTHAMWHAVAPLLAGDYTVIAADLPGYGGSEPVEAPSGTACPKPVIQRSDALRITGVRRPPSHTAAAILRSERARRDA